MLAGHFLHTRHPRRHCLIHSSIKVNINVNLYPYMQRNSREYPLSGRAQCTAKGTNTQENRVPSGSVSSEEKCQEECHWKGMLRQRVQQLVGQHIFHAVYASTMGNLWSQIHRPLPLIQITVRDHGPTCWEAGRCGMEFGYPSGAMAACLHRA